MAAGQPLNVSPGALFGLGAAIAWGVADFYIAVLGRRLGWFRTTVGLGIGAAVLVVIPFALLRPEVAMAGRDWIVLVVNAALVIPLLFTFYRALEEGPIAIVTPVVTAYAAIVVMLSLLLLRERLTLGQGLGTLAAIGGVLFASVDLRKMAEGQKRIGLGVWLGIASMIGFGLSAFVGAFYAHKYGWLVPAFFGRMIISSSMMLLAAMRRQWPWQQASPRVVLWVTAIGALEYGGYLMYARGAELGFISIVAAASASYPLIPLVLGIAVFKERLAPNQGVGVAVVLAGVLLLSLSG